MFEVPTRLFEHALLLSDGYQKIKRSRQAYFS